MNKKVSLNHNYYGLPESAAVQVVNLIFSCEHGFEFKKIKSMNELEDLFESWKVFAHKKGDTLFLDYDPETNYIEWASYWSPGRRVRIFDTGDNYTVSIISVEGDNRDPSEMYLFKELSFVHE